MIANKIKTKKEGKLGDALFPVLLGVLFVGVVAFLLISNIRIINERADLGKDIDSLEEEIAMLQEVKAKYEQGLISAEEAVYWEEKLREQGYKKPGEEAIVVLPQEEEEQGGEVELNFWDKIKGFFGI